MEIRIHNNNSNIFRSIWEIWRRPETANADNFMVICESQITIKLWSQTVTAYVYNIVYSELTACNPLLLGDCSTTNSSWNNGHVSHRPNSHIAYNVHSLLWSLLTTPWNKKGTAPSTVAYSRYTRIIHCRPCCNLLLMLTPDKRNTNCSYMCWITCGM